MAREVSDFVLQELTGARRTLRLRRSAKPQQGLALPMVTREKTVHYQGNIHGTQQIFGGHFAPITLQGMWRDWHLVRGLVTLDGQPVTTARALVDIVTSMWLAGSDMEMAWDGYRYRGIIQRFTPTWDRREDVGWELRFGTRGPGTEVSNQRYEPDFDPYGAPDSILRTISAFLSSVQAGIDNARAWEGQFTAHLGRVNTLRIQTESVIQSAGDGALAPLRLTSRVMQTATDLTGIFSAVRRVAQDATLGTMTVNTDALALARAFSSGSRISRAARVASGSTGRIVARARRRIEPDVRTIVRATEATDLRRVAAEQYGSASQWRRIATFNGFDGSLVKAGTIILVPEPTAA